MKKILLTGTILTFLDQYTKYLIQTGVSEPIVIFDPWFRFVYSRNPGIAFGLDIPAWLIVALNFILIPTIIYFAKTELNTKHPLTLISITLIIAGAIGNLIDRFNHGFVVDFISIGPWPNFNLADSYITVGVLLIIFFYGKINGNKKQKS